MLKTLKTKKSIWVFYSATDGIEPTRDKEIRDFLGEDAWYGSGLSLVGKRERDHSFDWSAAIEAKAIHLKAIGLIDRIQIHEATKQAA